VPSTHDAPAGWRCREAEWRGTIAPLGGVPVDIDEAETWIRSVVPSAGPLRLAQTEPWGSVYCADIGDGLVWFKACAPTHAFEAALTASLSSRWPRAVTDVLAHRVDRRWLLMADAGEPLRLFGNPPERWLELLPGYAELQVGETAHVAEHLEHGVPDLRVERLPALYQELVRAELPLDASDHAALQAFAPRFAALCGELEAAGIGPSVQHDDLHMNNVYVKGDALRVLDWGDASIAHPFFSLFEVFRFLGEVNHLPPDDPWFGRLRDAYLEPWGQDRRELFEVADVVGGFAHAIAWLHQRDNLAGADRQAFDGGFRTVLRSALGS
jgi:hypothetical protein